MHKHFPQGELWWVNKRGVMLGDDTNEVIDHRHVNGFHWKKEIPVVCCAKVFWRDLLCHLCGWLSEEDSWKKRQLYILALFLFMVNRANKFKSPKIFWRQKAYLPPIDISGMIFGYISYTKVKFWPIEGNSWVIILRRSGMWSNRGFHFLSHQWF